MNTHEFTHCIDQVQRLWETHVPPEYQVPVFPVAIGLLVLGIGLSVLGAKLARFGITCGFGAVGILVTAALAPDVELPWILVLLLGALLGVGVGYGMFRLWVGLAAAVFFAALAVGVYSSQAVVPHFIEYEPANHFDGTFTLPEPVGCDRLDRSRVSEALSDVRAWASDFWLYVQQQESDVNRKVLGIGLGAGLVGLLLGALVPRFTLIVGSSVLGTVLVMSGLAGLAAEFQVDLSQAGAEHGRIVATAGIVFLLASLLLQTLLTRQPPPPPRPLPQ